MKDAIQGHADNYEHPPPIPKFVVESRIVTEYIAEQQRNYVDNRLCKSEYSHSNLHSDILSKDEMRMLINCGTQISTWKDHNCSQTSTTQMSAIGKLLRAFRWQDMTLVDAHGPEMLNDDSRHPMMGLIEKAP